MGTSCSLDPNLSEPFHPDDLNACPKAHLPRLQLFRHEEQQAPIRIEQFKKDFDMKRTLLLVAGAIGFLAYATAPYAEPITIRLTHAFPGRDSLFLKPLAEQFMQANPDITAWAMIGGWPLFTDNALKWKPGAVKCVSVDALPPELAYLRSGHVQLLLAQQVYEWGHRSIEHLFNKAHFKKDPASVRDVSPLIPVTKESVDAFAKNWEKWLPK